MIEKKMMFLVESSCLLYLRFPDSHLMSSFNVLGMRPVTLLSGADLDQLMGILTVTSPAVVSARDTTAEWMSAKKKVKCQMYPRFHCILVAPVSQVSSYTIQYSSS